MKSEKISIEVRDLKKTYYTQNKEISVLKNLNAEFYSGKFYAIMGHSGNGKSTLIRILGLIDKFDEGEYQVFGRNVKNLNDKESSYLRMDLFFKKLI